MTARISCGSRCARQRQSHYMTRYKAFLLHLLGSAAVISLVFGFVRLAWYPGQLFDATGGADLMSIVIAVDVVLGPMITLVVFNPKKASLKFDMAFVFACQIAFLFYGVWAISAARPVYVVLVGNNFYMVTANEIDPIDQEKSEDPRFQSMPFFGPEFVGTRVPTDPKVIRDIIAVAPHGMGLQNLPEYFLSYDEIRSAAIVAGKTLDELAEKNVASPKEELEILRGYETRMRTEGKKVIFIPLLNKKKILTVAIDGSTGNILEIL